MLNPSDIDGRVGFLNGEPGLHEQEQELHDYLEANRIPCLKIDNLFEEPEKLEDITLCENIVFSTTGIRADRIVPLVERFKELDHQLEKVIFASKTAAESFTGLAREYKEKYGTKFYQHYCIIGGDWENTKLDWI